MLTLDLPPVADQLPERIVDWLQEHDVTLSDVLRWYAGEPPTYLAESFAEDEARRLVLALWLEVVLGEESLYGVWLVNPIDPRVGTTESIFGQWSGKEYCPRHQLVRECEFDRGAAAREWYEYPPQCVSIQDCRRNIDNRLDRPRPTRRYSNFNHFRGELVRIVHRHRRQHKRRVLALFPDAILMPSYECLACVDLRDWPEINEREWSKCPECGDQGIIEGIAAPDWIPEQKADA